MGMGACLDGNTVVVGSTEQKQLWTSNTWELKPALCYLPEAPTQLLGPTRPRLGHWRLRVATVPLDMQQTGQALSAHH